MIKTIIYSDISTSLRRKKVQSPAKQFKELSVWFVTSLHWINPLCIELPENCIYLNQSELSNFFMYVIIDNYLLLVLH